MAQPPIVVVDENDNPVGESSMQEVQAKGLWHRIVRVMVENVRGQILLQKRSQKVFSYQGCWDHSAAGHVDVGETYETAATRELREEIGLEAELQEVGQYKGETTKDNRIMKRFNRVYKTIVSEDAKVEVDPEEVAEVKWFTLDEIKKMIAEEPELVTDGLVDVINRYY